MSLCFSLDKITHDFVVRDFFGKTTSSCYITVEKFFLGPGLEPVSLASRASALATKLFRTSTDT